MPVRWFMTVILTLDTGKAELGGVTPVPCRPRIHRETLLSQKQENTQTKKVNWSYT